MWGTHGPDHCQGPMTPHGSVSKCVPAPSYRLKEGHLELQNRIGRLSILLLN